MLEKHPLNSILNYKSGKSALTKAYMNEHNGLYPVYSSKTIGETLVGQIDTYEFVREGLQLTTNGANAGTWIYREKHRFSLNGDARLYFAKEEFADTINLKYLLFALPLNSKNSIETRKQLKVMLKTLKD